MKLSEVTEAPVESSWITDITLADDGSVTVALNDGKRYSVEGVGDAVYQQWMNAPSKGKFFHEQIKDNYEVRRLI